MEHAKVEDSGNGEIEITDAMTEAGMDELRQHQLPGDWPYVLECIFRAMAYESPSASLIISSSAANATEETP